MFDSTNFTLSLTSTFSSQNARPIKRKAVYTFEYFSIYHISSNNLAGMIIILLEPKEASYLREGSYSREAMIFHYNFVLLSRPVNQKTITSSRLNTGLLNTGFFKCSKFGSMINFQC